jgi:hypothetical protein
MVLRIKSLDTKRKEEKQNTKENKVKMGKETEELQDLYCTKRLESFTVKSRKQRKNLDQG